ncbi:hypothetical protein ABGB17_14595 [Sphaerisporangium sp. B11E5]|uniref:hypothetical protein n=1 Tax=Sphaerisporangium sp. B11E5 TaxID=3153563 RepID=UPI00325D0A75
MSSGRTTAAIYLAGFCGLLLIALIFFAPRPIWLGFLGLILLGGLIVGVLSWVRRADEPGPYTPAAPPVPPLERRERRITEVTLPSAWSDYDFVFSATIHWTPTGLRRDDTLLNPGAAAVEAILKRARRITEDRPPNRVSLVQHELSGALGRMKAEETGCLQAMADSVTLTLSDDDRNRLAKLAAARKENTVWEHETKYEQSRRAYLSESVLKDTGSAVVWYLAKNDDQVEKTVKDIGLLAQLSSAANNTHVPEPFQHLVLRSANGQRAALPEEPTENHDFAGPEPMPQTGADHFSSFMSAIGLENGDAERVLMAREVADVLRAHGRHDQADELVRRFDVPEASHLDDFDGSVPPDDGGSR